MCENNAECESGICFDYRCVDATDPAHLNNCFGPTKLPECAECWEGPECESNKCVNMKCVYPTEDSLSKCFKLSPGVQSNCMHDMHTGEEICP